MSGNRFYIYIPRLNTGGAENVVIDNISHFLDAGHTPILLTDKNQSVCLGKLDSRVSIVHVTDSIMGKLKFFFGFFASPKDKNLLVVHLLNAGLAVGLVKKIAEIFFPIKSKIFIVSHIVESDYIRRLSFFKRLVLPRLLYFIYQRNVVIAVSEVVREDLVNKFGVSTKVISTIENPISKVDLSLASFPCDPTLVVIARLVKNKSVGFCVRAFSKASKNINRLKLVVVGDGPLRTDLEALVDNLDCKNNVRFVGWADNVQEVFGGASILLSGSDIESFGLVYFEALANGVPVIGRRNVAIDYYFSKNPYVDIVDSVDDMASSIISRLQTISLLSDKSDLLMGAGIDGFEAVKKYEQLLGFSKNAS